MNQSPGSPGRWKPYVACEQRAGARHLADMSKHERPRGEAGISNAGLTFLWSLFRALFTDVLQLTYGRRL